MVLWPDEWERSGELDEELRRGDASPAAHADETRERMPPGVHEARFAFHGLTVGVRSDSSPLVERLGRELAYFRSAASAAPPDVRLGVHAVDPPWDWVPLLTAVRYTERAASFCDGTTAYVEYFAGALAIVEHGARRADLYTRDPDLAHELARRIILTAVGRTFDARGLHRIDALALSDRGRGVAVLLPPGTERRALARELLRRPGLFLLGDDAALVDRRGRILAFPLDAPAFASRPGRLGDVATARLLLVAERSSGAASSIVPTSKPVALRALIAHTSGGCGLDRAPELLLSRGARDALEHGETIASRVASALRLLARVRPYRLVLGRDEAERRRVLHDLLDVEAARSAPA